MSYHSNEYEKQFSVRKMMGISMLTAAALTLSYIERFIPLNSVMPGAKLGLANVVTLVALAGLGFVEVLIIVLLRVLMTAFITGSIISFFYSLAGGILSLAGMYLALRYLKKIFSMVGISIIGAALHNTGQMIVFSFIIGSFRTAFWWYPYLLLTGLGTGIVTGFVAMYFYNHMQLIPHINISNYS